MKYLLDTNVISEIRKRNRADPNVVKWVADIPAYDLGTSVIVLAEIRRGIESKRRVDIAQAEILEAWYQHMREELGDRVLSVNEPVAEAWAKMSVPNPLPLMDGLLAATAKVYGLTLVTRNITDIARTEVSIINPFIAL